MQKTFYEGMRWMRRKGMPFFTSFLHLSPFSLLYIKLWSIPLFYFAADLVGFFLCCIWDFSSFHSDSLQPSQLTFCGPGKISDI
jgi:hypothetical protein